MVIRRALRDIEMWEAGGVCCVFPFLGRAIIIGTCIVIVADGYDDFERAMRKKLLRELATSTVSDGPKTLDTTWAPRGLGSTR